MPDLKVFTDGDGVWPDLKDRPRLTGKNVEVARLPKGMESGKSSVSIRIDTEDGQVVWAETSLELFLMAAKIFVAAEERDAKKGRMD